jgi:serine/threonine-protein kinase
VAIGMHSDDTERYEPATASAPALADMKSELGRFGAYELLEAHPGGMGVVFRARHTVLGWVVALKVLNPGRPLTAADRARFETEAKAVAQLKHPNIVAIREFDEHEGRPYFTMDFVEGGSLSKRVPEFTGQPKQAAALVEKVARAVHAVHEQKIWHRDLKPANILMRGPDDPVVADFGLAKMADGDLSLTVTGAMLGTPPYMAPEQFTGQHQLFGPPTDVWALGVILHELLTGKRPFAGSSHEELRSTVLTTDPPPPSQVDPNVPPALDAVVLRCLAHEPADRYHSAKDLADDLALWQAGQRPKTRRPLTRAARRRRRRLTIAAAVLVFLTLATIPAGLIWWRSLDHEEKLRQELALTKRVELVGATGPPRSYRAVTDNVEIVAANADGTFAIRSEGLGLLELMSTTGQERYRFRADMSYTSRDQGGAGLYVGREEFPPGDAQWICLVGSGFVRSLPAPPHPPHEIFAFQIRYCGARTGQGGVTSPIWPSRTQIDEQPLDRWRTIEFNVSRESIGTSVGDEFRPPPVPRTELMASAEKRSKMRRPSSYDGVTPTFDPRGGIGIYLDRATVRLRNVSVEVTR